MAAPCLRGGHPGRPQLDGAGGGGEGRGGDLMAGASRQVIAGDSLLVCPKTWRRRLAVQRAGVADRDEMMSSEVRWPASLHLLLALTSSMSLRWSLCPQPTLGHQGNLSSCQLDDPQLPTEILTYGHPKLDGWHPGRRRRDGAGAGAEGRGSEQGAEAARQATGAAGSGACPKTGRRRLALWRAGVADRGRDESSRCAAGRDRGARRAGGQRTVSAAPEARRPGPAGWRGCSSTLRSARCGLCR